MTDDKLYKSPSEQDGAILPAWEYPLYHARKISQVCLVKMAGYWPCSFFCEKHAKKELGQYPGILTKHSVNNPCNYLDRTSWSTKDLL